MIRTNFFKKSAIKNELFQRTFFEKFNQNEPWYRVATPQKVQSKTDFFKKVQSKTNFFKKEGVWVVPVAALVIVYGTARCSGTPLPWYSIAAPQKSSIKNALLKKEGSGGRSCYSLRHGAL